jgi:hypothetical protein
LSCFTVSVPGILWSAILRHRSWVIDAPGSQPGNATRVTSVRYDFEIFDIPPTPSEELAVTTRGGFGDGCLRTGRG